MRNENSVLFALRDLRAIEADRVAEERQRAEEERQRIEDERRRAEETERARRALAEAARQNERLEAALDEMRATVARLAEERRAGEAAPAALVVPLPSEPAPIAPPRRAVWPLALAGVALVIALFAATRPRVVYVPTPLPSSAPAASAPATLPASPTPPPSSAQPSAQPVERAPAPVVIARPAPHAPKKPRPKPPAAPKPPSLPSCGDDPLCGAGLGP